MRTFAYVRTEQWNGTVEIYRYGTSNKGIAISRAFTFDRGDETMIFPYDLRSSQIVDWGDLYAGYGVGHDRALAEYMEDFSERDFLRAFEGYSFLR